ncbi:MAG: hypothetical protein ACK5MZ_10275, partial [Aestuariibaculum sp.]
GNTVLFTAIEKRNKPLIELYLEYGAECNIQNLLAETPYHKVLFTAVDSDIFDMLNNYEPIRLDLKNKQNQTIFFEFVNYGGSSWSNSQIELLHKLLDNGADLYQTENNIYNVSLTPAQILGKKSFALFEMMVNQDDFNPNQQDNQGNTWLHYVCSEDLNFDQQKAQELYKKVKLLLKKGADPKQTNDQDKTAIDYAQSDDLKVKALALLLK